MENDEKKMRWNQIYTKDNKDEVKKRLEDDYKVSLSDLSWEKVETYIKRIISTNVTRIKQTNKDNGNIDKIIKYLSDKNNYIYDVKLLFYMVWTFYEMGNIADVDYIDINQTIEERIDPRSQKNIIETENNINVSFDDFSGRVKKTPFATNFVDLLFDHENILDLQVGSGKVIKKHGHSVQIGRHTLIHISERYVKQVFNTEDSEWTLEDGILSEIVFNYYLAISVFLKMCDKIPYFNSIKEFYFYEKYLEKCSGMLGFNVKRDITLMLLESVEALKQKDSKEREIEKIIEKLNIYDVVNHIFRDIVCLYCIFQEDNTKKVIISKTDINTAWYDFSRKGENLRFLLLEIVREKYNDNISVKEILKKHGYKEPNENAKINDATKIDYISIIEEINKSLYGHTDIDGFTREKMNLKEPDENAKINDAQKYALIQGALLNI